MIYVLDTNVVIDALRQPAELARLTEFLRWALPSTVFSSVVAAELAAGARTSAARRALDEVLFAAFERRGRIRAPSASAWRSAGAIMARAGETNRAASRQNDLLLAAQARESGWTVVTRDRDFGAIRSHVPGLRVVAPFPGGRITT